ncbi:vegetative cell wall protein gp1-like [Sorghum bicolor]|uniref:vegetative cell wall protein gp1-like n=1 Tax=Sorghum bicolor TaxID=4558 RepID=UPI000B424B12|nr:vegetative cell wall protein gp1-like [Sorghum bicolor]|eukprot:XP_021309055.1 vegetative cell wall protein gp1-like [Sorghum bicolor]
MHIVYAYVQPPSPERSHEQQLLLAPNTSPSPERSFCSPDSTPPDSAPPHRVGLRPALPRRTPAPPRRERDLRRPIPAAPAPTAARRSPAAPPRPRLASPDSGRPVPDHGSPKPVRPATPRQRLVPLDPGHPGPDRRSPEPGRPALTTEAPPSCSSSANDFADVTSRYANAFSVIGNGIQFQEQYAKEELGAGTSVPEKSLAGDEELGVETSVPEKKIELDLPENKSSARRRSVRSSARAGDDRWGRRWRRSLGTRARQWGRRGRDGGDEGATVVSGARWRRKIRAT